MTQVDQHFPPNPNPSDNPEGWNPDTNEWAPSNEQHSTFGVAEPSHGDEPNARPMSDMPGMPPANFGSTPDARMNLIDAVRSGAQPATPTTIVHHVVETQEVGSDLVRGRVVHLPGDGQTRVALLEENPNRVRALIKPITTNGVILVTGRNMGGMAVIPAAVPVGNQAAYPQATGDPVMVIESCAAVDAYATNAVAGGVDVAVWEELTNPAHAPTPGV